MPAAIFVIPYADLMFAIIRRTRAGKPIMVADRQHLHHRLLNIGHSYRQSVLLMYLWAALFSVTVVSLSVVRSPSSVFAAATVVAVLALLPATMPRLRPRWAFGRRKASTGAASPGAASSGAATPGAATLPPGTRYHAASPPADRAQAPAVQSAAPVNTAGRVADTDPAGSAPGYLLPRAPRRPSAEPFVSPAPFSGQAALPQFPFPDREPLPDPGPFPARGPLPDPGPFPARGPLPDPGPFPARGPLPDRGSFPDRGPFPASEPIPGQDPFNGEVPFPGVGPGYGNDALDRPDPLSQAQPPDMWPS